MYINIASSSTKFWDFTILLKLWGPTVEFLSKQANSTFSNLLVHGKGCECVVVLCINIGSALVKPGQGTPVTDGRVFSYRIWFHNLLATPYTRTWTLVATSPCNWLYPLVGITELLKKRKRYMYVFQTPITYIYIVRLHLCTFWVLTSLTSIISKANLIKAILSPSFLIENFRWIWTSQHQRP